MGEIEFPLKLFYCYAPNDVSWCDKLSNHLSGLQRERIITIWDKRKINPGEEGNEVYKNRLNEANIVILFISPDFMGSKDYDNDLQIIIENHEQKQTIVIPVLLRPVDLENARINRFQILPKDGLAITSCKNEDEALRDITIAIKEMLSTHPLFGETYLKNRQIYYEGVNSKEKAKLQSIVKNHEELIQNLLEKFTGRQNELIELRQQIAAFLPSGGYITITGRAGQGKSSIIAQLVHEYELQNVAHHFVPVNPGQNYLVKLMQNLIAYFVHKYQLSELYTASENLSVLSDYFLKILREIEGNREVILIDALDQLEGMQTGISELKFLPDKPLQDFVGE